VIIKAPHIIVTFTLGTSSAENPKSLVQYFLAESADTLRVFQGIGGRYLADGADFGILLSLTVGQSYV
jgi:hypothetical protein